MHVFVRTYVDVLTSDFGRCLVLSGIAPLEIASREEIVPSLRHIDTAVRKMVALGVADGSIAPCNPKIAAFTLFGALHWMTSWYRPDGELTPDELATQILTVLTVGLQARGGATRRAAGTG